MDSEIRRKKVQDLLSKECLSSSEKKILIRLYLFCNKLDKYFSITKKNKKETLRKMENDIYNINNKYLNDIEKIKLEFLYYQNINKPNLKNYIQDLQNLLIKYHDKLTEKEIENLKEIIVKLQILNNNNITFFNSSYELFNKFVEEEEIKRIKRG